MKVRDSSWNVLAVVAAISLTVLLPVLYVLSFGPAIWLVHRGTLDVMTIVGAYRPLLAFAYDHPWFNELMTWYIGWFGGPVSL